MEQLCVWREPLEIMWPPHAGRPTYELPRSWPGWPNGRVRAVEAFKLHPDEVGINRAELRFDRGGLRIQTGGLAGDEVDSLVLSPLD